MAENLLIVESPSKAKTLKKYLGRDFDVLASYGHVRDLIPKNGAVDPDHDFAMKYELIARNSRHVDAIAQAVKQAKHVYLAPDPDREGEAIAWHIAEILKQKKLLKDKTMQRVVFHEITESAVNAAIAAPRDIAMPLVNAQQARRALDYLVGFNLSPLLWKKIGKGLSAGRVQSPALRMIVEREEEIEAFKAQEYWTVHLSTHKGRQKFSARLTHLNGQKLDQFTLGEEGATHSAIARLKAAGETADVIKIEKKRKQRSAAPPFTTSTLQQEAVRKLGFSSERTMRVAQQLYEGIDIGSGTVGLITYMRTDSFNLANEALDDIRTYIGKNFDADYLPAKPNFYRSKAKNAQEAHEAIRPTSIFRTPDSLRGHLTPDQLKLYGMIWKRALACQMSPAKFDTVALDLAVGKDAGIFRATGQSLVFAGFIAVYQEGEDDVDDEEETKLPVLEEGDTLPVDEITGEQHFTQPPPRYSEASLVKALEEHGIGRPSTYVSIITTLQNRNYVVLEKKRFMPTETGRAVNSFLTRHFTRYVDYDFTAKLEDQLDAISNAQKEWVPVLADFWQPFHTLLDEKQTVERGEALDEACPKCGKMLFKYPSKRGFFVGCSGYPECDYTRPWEGSSPLPTAQSLGEDPATGMPIQLLKGPYGHYVQLGEKTEDNPKPQRASWPKTISLDKATLEIALKLLALPRTLGEHPVSGKPIKANNGRFGPYVQHDSTFASIPKTDNVYEIGLERALQLINEKELLAAKSALGVHPADQQPIEIKKGRFGPYVKYKGESYRIPAGTDPLSLTLEQALELIAAKEVKPAEKKPARKTVKK